MCVRQIWMCGGVLEIATCSHVGHVFRKSTPYSFPGGTSKVVNHNNARLAEVWLDDWKHFYYSINPGQVSSLPLPLPVSLQLPLRAEFVKVHINSVIYKAKLTRTSPDNLGALLWVDWVKITEVLACHPDNTRTFDCCRVSDKALYLEVNCDSGFDSYNFTLIARNFFDVCSQVQWTTIMLSMISTIIILL